MERVTFARDELGVGVYDDAAMKRLYARYLQQPGPVAREVGDIARAERVKRVNELWFSTPGRTQEESDKEVARRFPHIATIAAAPISESGARFMSDFNVEIIGGVSA
jgi:hypothetical protein